MKPSPARLAPLFTLATCLFCLPAAPAQSIEDFTQLLETLARNPKDISARERVIKAALELKPRPEIPEAARRHVARGEAAIETAETPADWELAVKEFEQAANAAPWSASCYYNLAAVQEEAGRPRDAMQSLKFYLLADPEAKDAEAVKTKIYKLEFRLEKAQAKTAAEMKPKQVQAANLKSLEGEWRDGPSDSYVQTYGLTITGNTFELRHLSSYDRQGGRTYPSGKEVCYHGTINDDLTIAGRFVQNGVVLAGGRIDRDRKMENSLRGNITADLRKIHLYHKTVFPNNSAAGVAWTGDEKHVTLERKQ